MDWRDKTVFLTGHTGFKGSWLSLWLQQMGVNVVGYALEPPTEPSLFKTANVADRMHSVTGNILDYGHFKSAMQDAKPDIVIHMAAQSLVRKSYDSPIETLNTNVIGTAHCLDIVRSCPDVKVVIVVTTDKCYENLEQLKPYKEDDKLGGHDLYSGSKACTEIVSKAYIQSFFKSQDVRIATVRAGNVIGGGDFAKDRLIPDYFRQHFNQQILHLRYPAAVRPWQHVLEPLKGYLTLIEKLWDANPEDVLPSAWNFGPEESACVTVEELVTKLSQYCHDSIPIEIDQTDHLHEANLLMLSIEQAKSQLNWAPKMSLDDALRITSEWYHTHQTGGDVKALCLSQIQQYLSI